MWKEKTDFNILIVLFCYVCLTHAAAENDEYKNQYCTDPRTMHKHQAYTEWADAYSCTRHRCQPGGRKLAIYTVGCKRVEAPESAIECEEVVEDTNMQFPYCCTRLRCLVVVRGEVWTRVLGQPWETLPAAPWSHMYKMKKPAPEAGVFPGEKSSAGPVYELTDLPEHDAVERSALRSNFDTSGTTGQPCDGASEQPDIIIAVEADTNDIRNDEKTRFKLTSNKKIIQSSYSSETAEKIHDRMEIEQEEQTSLPDNVSRRKKLEPSSDRSEEQRYYGDFYGVTERPHAKSTTSEKIARTEAQFNIWDDAKTEPSVYMAPPIPERRQSDADEDHKKSDYLKELVAAIGTRMHDIETVVQRMSQKVETLPERAVKLKQEPKRSNDVDSSYRSRGSKHVRTREQTTELALVEDDALNGYFNDAGNPVRRSNSPKEPTHNVIRTQYVAPVEPRRSNMEADQQTKKQKKRAKKNKKSHRHRTHKKKAKSLSSETKRRRLNKINSMELDRNVVSFEDSSDIAAVSIN